MIRPVLLVNDAAADPAPVSRGVPLSHHDILARVAPFSRAGWRVDLNASRRADRQIAFVPRDHAGEAQQPALRETLSLHVPAQGSARLVRRVTVIPEAAVAGAPADNAGDAGALQSRAQNAVSAGVPDTALAAVLTLDGSDAADLLAHLNRFALSRHFECVDGVWLARSYQVNLDDDENTQPSLVSAHARIAGIAIDVDARTDYPLRLELTPTPGERLLVPEDLLAVIGRPWRPLRDFDSHWRGTIGVARKEPVRSAQSETLLRKTIAHLAATLNDSPAHYHQRFQAQRWQVVMRRMQPLFAILLLLLASMAVGQFQLSEGSFLLMVILHAPPLMLIALFAMREMPRFEIPMWPRRLRQDDWQQAVRRDAIDKRSAGAHAG